MRQLLLFFAFAGCAHSIPTSRPSSITPESAQRLLSEIEATYDNPSQELAARLEAEWTLQQSLEQARLLNLAFFYAMALVKAPQHPHHADAVRSLIRIHQADPEAFLVSLTLDKNFSTGTPAFLNEAESARLAWLRARLAFRRGRLQEAVTLCVRVPAQSPVFAQAEYLRAVALADPQLDGVAEANTVLERLSHHIDPAQEGAAVVKAQVPLALARIAYGQKRWSDSVSWYTKAAENLSVRSEALFEQSLALYQLGDFKAALASLRTDEAWNAMPREASLLEAVVLHASGDAKEAERALARVGPRTKSEIDWENSPPTRALDALQTERGVTAEDVRQARRGARLGKLLSFLESYEAERRRVNEVPEWKGTSLRATLDDYLERNLGTVREVVGGAARKEFKEIEERSEATSNSAELFGVDIALAHRDLELAIERAERAPPTSDLLFRLAALKQAKAEVQQGAAAEATKLEVRALIQRVLEDASYPRQEEARAFLKP